MEVDIYICIFFPQYFCPLLVAAFFSTIINTKRKLTQWNSGIANSKAFSVTCTDASCFLFSEAWLPELEAWSFSGTVLPLFLPCHIFITTQTQNAHMQLIWRQTYKDSGTNHTNVDTLIFHISFLLCSFDGKETKTFLPSPSYQEEGEKKTLQMPRPLYLIYLFYHWNCSNLYCTYSEYSIKAED